LGLRARNRAAARSPRASPRAPATECGLPEIPSLEGYTIQELRIEQLARLMKLGELKPEQVTNLGAYRGKQFRIGQAFRAGQLSQRRS
jgi:hypothetical protein